MKLSHVVLVAFTCFMIFLTTEVGVFDKIGKATIEDSVVGAKYQVVSVDGNLPERAKHGLIVTVVPLVLVKSGSHKIELKKANRPLDEKEESATYLVETEIESGETYRILEVDGQPKISLKE